MSKCQSVHMLTIFTFALQTTATWATPIVVNNPGFDDPGFDENTGMGTSDEPAFFATNAWHATPASGQAGILNYDGNVYPGATDTTPTSQIETESGGPGVPDGSSVAFQYFGSAGGGFTGELWQTTGALFERGTYTINVYAGNPAAGTPYGFPDARIRLYAGTDVTTGVLLKEMSITNIPTPGAFQLNTFTFGTNDLNWSTLFAANELQPLTISLYAAINGREEVDWDLVTFDFVPEPTAAVLVGMAGFWLLRRRWH